jgi:hypothetical protein
MPYYVIGDDGQKYGPADVATLNQWIAENRLVRTQILEDEASGSRMAASAVEGLNFPPPAAAPGPQGPGAGPLPGSHGYGGNYARPGGYVPDDGSTDVRNAWIFFATGLLCCGLLHIGSIICGNNAQAKGNSAGATPKILSIIFLILQVIGGALYGYMAMHAVQAGMQPGTFAPPAR